MIYNKHLSPGAPGKAGLQSEPLEGVRTATGIPASGSCLLHSAAFCISSTNLCGMLTSD